MQFNRLLEVGKGFFLGLALAGDVEFQALGDVPFPLTPNSSREWSLHDLIFSQARLLRTVLPFRPNLRAAFRVAITHNRTAGADVLKTWCLRRHQP